VDGPPGAGPAPAAVISGEVLRGALSTRFAAGSPDPEIANPLAIGSLEGDPTNLAHVGQSLIDSHSEQPPITYYSQVSGQLANNNLTNVAIGVPWLDQVLGSTMSAGSGPYTTTLTGPAPVAITDDKGPYELDTTLAHWEAAPWFVQLQIQSDRRSESMFRLCLHYRLPDAIRLSCGLFDRSTAEHRGVYVVDDSDALGAKTWRTH
jgi:hypothetical protein